MSPFAVLRSRVRCCIFRARADDRQAHVLSGHEDRDPNSASFVAAKARKFARLARLHTGALGSLVRD